MTNTQIIGIGNQKGGVCKTTNAIHLAAALGERGQKCLVIDLDANLGLTYSFDVPTTVFGTFHMLMGQASAEDVIISNETRQERASRPGEMITLPKNGLMKSLPPLRQRMRGLSSWHHGIPCKGRCRNSMENMITSSSILPRTLAH